MSDKERARRETQREESKKHREAQREELRQLLYTRGQVAKMLGGVSIATIRRLESERRLKSIRLSKSPTAMVFFKASDVHALIEEATNV
jgi:hypothetical protein